MKITRNSRKHDRIRVKGILKYVADPDASNPQARNIREISEGGLSFLMEQKLEPGTKLTLSALIFPLEIPIDIHAVVVGCHETNKKTPLYRISLRFLDVSEASQATLHEILGYAKRNKSKQKNFPFVLRFRD